MTDHRTTDQPRFSLRQLLALTTALAGYFAVLGWAVRNAEDSSVAVIVAEAAVTAVLIHVTISALTRRERAILQKSSGHRYATLNAHLSLREITWFLAKCLAGFGVFCLVMFDRRTDFATFMLIVFVLMPALWVESWLRSRKAAVTDEGLLVFARLTRWSDVRCERDEDGAFATLGSQVAGDWGQSPRYFVPEKARPIVAQLVDDARERDREGEAPAEPMRIASAGSAEASPSRDI